MPLPVGLVVKNGSPTRPRISGAMPPPRSATWKTKRPVPPGRARAARRARRAATLGARCRGDHAALARRRGGAGRRSPRRSSGRARRRRRERVRRIRPGSRRPARGPRRARSARPPDRPRRCACAPRFAGSARPPGAPAARPRRPRARRRRPPRAPGPWPPPRWSTAAWPARGPRRPPASPATPAAPGAPPDFARRPAPDRAPPARAHAQQKVDDERRSHAERHPHPAQVQGHVPGVAARHGQRPMPQEQHPRRRQREQRQRPGPGRTQRDGRDRDGDQIEEAERILGTAGQIEQAGEGQHVEGHRHQQPPVLRNRGAGVGDARQVRGQRHRHQRVERPHGDVQSMPQRTKAMVKAWPATVANRRRTSHPKLIRAGEIGSTMPANYMPAASLSPQRAGPACSAAPRAESAWGTSRSGRAGCASNRG